MDPQTKITHKASNVLLFFFLPVLIENCVSRLGLVLHSSLVDSICLFKHLPVLQLLRPGHVEGGRPVTHSFTVKMGVQGSGVWVKTCL